jgi:RHS repeat-associated protein
MTQATYVYGNYMDEVLTMDRGGAPYYYHQNALWSVEAITDSTATPVEVYAYDAYGLPAISTGSGTPVPPNAWGTPHSAVGNPWMFTGRQLDEDTGLYYYRARYYDSVKGRFLQRDFEGYVDGMNLYEYVGDNPVQGLDPSGLETYGECFAKCFKDIDKTMYAQAVRTCADQCKGKKGPGNCHAYTCEKEDGPFAWKTGFFPGTREICKADPKNNVKYITYNVQEIRDDLENAKGKNCAYQGNQSCDGQKGCIKIWLQKASVAYPDMYEALKRLPNDNAKTQAQRFPDCYVPAHTAKITCDKGDCAYIFGLDKPEVNRVESFAKVVDGSGQKYPEDAAEYWKCKCP